MLLRTKILLASTATVAVLGLAGGAIADNSGKQSRSAAMFEMLDENKDGKVTEEEAVSYRDDKFTEFDKDGNGELSVEEYTVYIYSIVDARMKDRFARNDADNSGGISKEEMSERFMRTFERMDRNDDGAVEKTEMRRPAKSSGESKTQAN